MKTSTPIPRPGGEAPSLFRRVSLSVFWNTLLLPLVTLFGVIGSVLIRRGFGLRSGVYDILLGILGTTLNYSSLGIPTSLTKFLPEIDAARGRPAVAPFLGRAILLRMGILALVLLVMNVFAEDLAAELALGDGGVFLLRLLTFLILLRALYDLVVKTLQAFLAHLAANVLVLFQAVLEPALIAVCLLLGYGIGGLVGALIASAVVLVATGAVVVSRTIHTAPPAPRQKSLEATGAAEPMDPDASFGATLAASPGGLDLWRFSFFTYAYEIFIFLAGPSFAKLALAVTLGSHEPVALFATGYQVAFMICGFVVSGFRGVYRPMFAHLRAEGSLDRLREAFEVVSKVQVGLLLPAGTGLALLAPDVLPLVYGQAFAAAAPVTQILVALLFAETAFNLGIILLSIDERYRDVLFAQLWLLLAAPLFVWTAATAGLLAGAAVLGAGRMLVTVTGYVACRRRYGVRFPWMFTLRIAGASAVMAIVLAAGRAVWPTSWAEAVTLTVAGFFVFVGCIRVAGVIGAAEADLVRRAAFPGHAQMLRWLAPSS